MTLFEQFLDKMNGASVAVIGIGVSNRPLISLLLKAGAIITACDKKTEEQLGELAQQLKLQDVRLSLGRSYLENLTQDYIFKSPGIRADLPQIESARKRGCHITSEMEVFFNVCPCRIIGVTGSDGKTTTTTLIHEILAKSGKRTWVGGNIGQPLLSMAGEMTAADLAIVELSSFQLMTMKKSPSVAVITNITPNHLDMHKSMEEYVLAKENVYAYQRRGDLLVLNADNKITAGFRTHAKGSLQMFSRRNAPENGAFLKDGVIYKCKGGRMEEIMRAEDIKIPGMHNIENYMAAICAVSDFADIRHIRDVAQNFEGVEHRIEFMRELDGVKYYNDAIATSPARAIAGLHAFDKKVIAIVGGYDKQIPFDEYGDEACLYAKLLIINGATAAKIREAVLNSKNYASSQIEMIECETLQQAVQTARAKACKGDIVTLSPACASFDAYTNFMAKGEDYKRMINELK